MKLIIVILGVGLAIGLIMVIVFKRSRVEHQAAGSSSAQEWGNYQDIVELARKIQMDYWTPNANEKAQLLSRDFNDLTWKEKLRLLHLTCLEAVPKDREEKLLINDDLEEFRAPNDSDRDMVSKILLEMISGDSPFRPQPAVIWQTENGRSDERNHDLEGVLKNISLTHIGCLEVIHLDENRRPKSLDFIPFDDLRAVVFATSGIYRYANLLFDDGRDNEIVLVPLLYGISFLTTEYCYQDGSLTRSLYFEELTGVDQPFAIGVGHQDLILLNESPLGTLFGIGSVAEIGMVLDISSPKFEQKCRFRGIDPEDVRKSIKQ